MLWGKRWGRAAALATLGVALTDTLACADGESGPYVCQVTWDRLDGPAVEVEYTYEHGTEHDATDISGGKIMSTLDSFEACMFDQERDNLRPEDAVYAECACEG